MGRAARLLVALTVSWTPAALAQASPAASARKAIDAANANWARLTTAGHSDSLAELYHANGVVYPPNMTAVAGKAAIRDFMAGISTMSSPPPVITLRADSVWSAGTWAVELGRWTWVWPAGAKLPPGEMQADSGKYMARWVLDKGKWVIAQDTWSSDLPPRPQSQK
jgi:ketosteroid isomerase-like protein